MSAALKNLKAARELVALGWMKGEMSDGLGCYCAAGAINAADGVYHQHDALYALADDMLPAGMREIAEALEALFPGRGVNVRVNNLTGRVWSVNDAVDTTKTDVIRAFDYAIEKEESRIAADKLA